MSLKDLSAGITYWFSCAGPALSEQETVPFKPSSAWDLSCFSRSRRRRSLAASSSSSTLHCAVSLPSQRENPSLMPSGSACETWQ